MFFEILAKFFEKYRYFVYNAEPIRHDTIKSCDERRGRDVLLFREAFPVLDDGRKYGLV